MSAKDFGKHLPVDTRRQHSFSYQDTTFLGIGSVRYQIANRITPDK